MSNLSEVQISSDAFLVCTTHALSTEKEEIMGLLLGDIEETNGGKNIAYIWATCVLNRADKRKDRVEISPEQLTAAAQEAEETSKLLQKRTRVIGWYHSHPHITVHPSHVDVKTQALYQTMDAGFIGLIFSCFNKTNDNAGRIQVIAFQSVEKSTIQKEIDLIDIGDVPASTDFGEAEIPLRIVNTLPSTPNNYSKLVQLQEIVKSEEEESYQRALTSSEKPHPLLNIHSSAVYEKSLCKLLETGCVPLMQILEQKVKLNKERIELLNENILQQKKFLENH